MQEKCKANSSHLKFHEFANLNASVKYKYTVHRFNKRHAQYHTVRNVHPYSFVDNLTNNSWNFKKLVNFSKTKPT